jgi:hypothetical protein
MGDVKIAKQYISDRPGGEDRQGVDGRESAGSQRGSAGGAGRFAKEGLGKAEGIKPQHAATTIAENLPANGFEVGVVFKLGADGHQAGDHPLALADFDFFALLQPGFDLGEVMRKSRTVALFIT